MKCLITKINSKTYVDTLSDVEVLNKPKKITKIKAKQIVGVYEFVAYNE